MVKILQLKKNIIIILKMKLKCFQKKEGICFKSRNQAIANLINNKNDIAILDDEFQVLQWKKIFNRLFQ